MGITTSSIFNVVVLSMFDAIYFTADKLGHDVDVNQAYRRKEKTDKPRIFSTGMNFASSEVVKCWV